ncbi:hypothetical protein SAMN05444336_102678 [Albimonas donghaensis]|uniref:DUF4148 domain-containing protein n=1 Tax=Albimonas donghaensis TaxID=356660 RepID=A0A1H2XBP9_9RHOB|nr:hypothetical protein [Albimonas donghaensis]SDW90168.1 hypothetical protein SAMN05444336_102678 [Albimonas donghaensis]
MTRRARPLPTVAAFAVLVALASPGVGAAQTREPAPGPLDAAAAALSAPAPASVSAPVGTPVATPGATQPPGADEITFRKLPYGTTQRFNARNAASPVDATPEIRALQDPDAEGRYQQQVERARALKALREAGSSSLSHLPDMTSGAPRN